ncbi:MAG: hypothetical protein JNK38_22810 [Acidobacteria bacterium]|nr:hypothetical protein [Acidobacteriota bacterium]
MANPKPDKHPKPFALCLREDQQGESLTIGKVYPVLSDQKAEAHGYIRIVDDSGEDYLYSKHFFVLVELPMAAEKALLEALSLTT